MRVRGLLLSRDAGVSARPRLGPAADDQRACLVGSRKARLHGEGASAPTARSHRDNRVVAGSLKRRRPAIDRFTPGRWWPSYAGPRTDLCNWRLVMGPTPAEASASLRRPLARALLVLTFSTGLVDAVSYLGLGRVFTANMTGNIVLLGFGIAGSGGLPVVAPLVSLGTFLVGSAVGGAMATRIGHRHAQHVARALGIETALVLCAAIVAAAADAGRGSFSRDAIIALLALGMGVRNATVRRLAVPDLTTTVLTMTLTGLAADSRVAGGSGGGSVRRIAAVLAMLLGAVAGALLLKISLVPPLLGAAALALLVVVAYLPATRRAA